MDIKKTAPGTTITMVAAAQAQKYVTALHALHKLHQLKKKKSYRTREDSIDGIGFDSNLVLAV
jgi:hypothetical protein